MECWIKIGEQFVSTEQYEVGEALKIGSFLSASSCSQWNVTSRVRVSHLVKNNIVKVSHTAYNNKWLPNL